MHPSQFTRASIYIKLYTARDVYNTLYYNENVDLRVDVQKGDRKNNPSRAV